MEFLFILVSGDYLSCLPSQKRSQHYSRTCEAGGVLAETTAETENVPSEKVIAFLTCEAEDFCF